EPQGRRLREIGILTGNPVKADVIWSLAHGEHTRYQEFLDKLSQRLPAPVASATNTQDAHADAESAQGLHIPAGTQGDITSLSVPVVASWSLQHTHLFWSQIKHTFLRSNALRAWSPPGNLGCHCHR